jgi:hypothetical protein
MATASRWERLLTPDTKIAVGAWLLCMTGILAFLNPSDRPASAAFRLTLAMAGFALYGLGRTEKNRARLIKAGATGAELSSGLSGWLIALLIMLCVTLVSAVIQAISDIPQIISGRVWAEFTTPGRLAYHPSWKLLLVLDWASNLFTVAFVPVVLALFFQKRKAFPKVMFWTLLIFVTLVGLRFGLANRISFLKGDALAMPLLFAIIKAVIWIPYLRVSKRVKATFVN